MDQKKKTNLLSGVLVLIVVVIVAVWFALHDDAPEVWPTLSVATVTMTDVNENAIDAEAKVRIDNPLPIDLSSTAIAYTVMIDSTTVVKDTHDEPLTIASGDSTVVTLPMQIKLAEMTSVLKQLKQQNEDSADYTLRARVHLNVPVAEHEVIELEKTLRLPVFLMPNVQVSDVDIEGLDFKTSQLEVTLQIDNPNTFPIQFKDMAFEARVDNDHTMSGAVPGVTEIPAHKSKNVPVLVRLSNPEVGELAWKSLFDKKDTHFNIRLTSALVSEHPMLNNSRMITQASGTLDELGEAAEQVNR